MLAFLAILLDGCAARKSPAIPWSTAVLVRPVALKRTVPDADLEDPLPELRMQIPPPPAPPGSGKPAPAAAQPRKAETHLTPQEKRDIEQMANAFGYDAEKLAARRRARNERDAHA